MLPLHQLSSVAINAPFLEVQNDIHNTLVDYELGGVALNDPTQGLRVKTWTLFVDGQDVNIKADDVAPVTLFSLPGIREVSLAFDQNMHPFVAFVQHQTARFWWFDTVVGHVVFTDLDEAVSPRCTLDDKRDESTGTSDILLAYVKDDNLYFRAERDRYTLEYLLKANVDATLISVGMMKNNRVKFRLRTRNLND